MHMQRYAGRCGLLCAFIQLQTVSRDAGHAAGLVCGGAGHGSCSQTSEPWLDQAGSLQQSWIWS